MIAVNLESKLKFYDSDKAKLYNALIVFAGALFIALSAQISVPLKPVPITLQSFAALFIGMALGPKQGGKAVLSYLIAGSIGLPVFANFSSGLHSLFSMTGGYLIGFVPASILTGFLLEKGWARYRVTAFLAGLLGTIVIFVCGYLSLSLFIGFTKAYLFGVAPFYLIEFAKLLLLASVVPFFWKDKVNAL
jgi:biotin transport system substrate-specific component